ncbi:Thioredoxin reductase [Furfurilactobacillus rossiae]|uniref:NAD(P)/FAD-dependent oxidoreductase n=1 Tax=Furfurilactobacillus rossiae TaxID=231049 RepID=UPI0015BD985E|nr:NAD(P)/FAD-dependent oxidoreductase [Furfurilactobacillus rossiae]MCF6164702.1 NAD(P)/FAD-dependent oxidoreductase [Furfurilactobacillus rossiae]QLE64991.1 Thioredoxin reductase [Furfurilactobacillus rossiae]
MDEAMYDLTIIGGGPVGLFAAFYAGLQELKTQVVESLPQVGGQLTTLYPEKRILDVAGFSHVTAQELVDRLVAQTSEFPVTIKTETTVTNVSGQLGDFTITTNKDVTHSKAVLVTTGNGAFTPRKLAVDNAEAFEGRNLWYFVPKVAQFKDHDVMIAGGGDAAIDIALMLEPVAHHVYLMHRRDSFRALPHSVTRLNESSVETVTPYLVSGLTANSKQVTVDLKEMKTDNHRTVTVDDLVVNYGFISDHSVFENWDLQFDQNRQQVAVDGSMKTSVDGIYAAGDTASYDGKVALIATGFGEAATAVHAASFAIDPHHRGPVHSTSVHLPNE